MVDSPPPPKKKKKFQNTHKHNSAVRPFNLICCGWILKKIDEISIYNQQVNKVTPHFTFMRRAQNADIHWIGCPKILPPSAPVLYWLSHVTCISSLEAKNVAFHTAKNVQIQYKLFSLFLNESFEHDLWHVHWSLTCLQCSLCLQQEASCATMNE